MKSGYKKTEVGIIPEDWDTKWLCEVVDFANGRPHEGDIRAGGRYFLITLDSIDISGGLKSQHKETDVWDGSLRKDDLVAVLSDLAHGNLLGLCDLIPEDGKFVLNQRMGRLRLKIPADPLFVRLQINRRQGHFKTRGQGTSQRHIYKRDFDALQIPFAPPHEQRAIAEHLRDMDRMMGSLDQLINKKRHLKQAAMRQLLTGQTRLPGFRVDWTAQRLGDIIVRLRKTGRQSAAGRADGAYPFFTNSTKPYDKFLDEVDFDTEAIIANTGGVAFFNYYNGPFSAMADCLVFETKVVTGFLFYLLKTLESRVNEVAFTGSGIRHLDKKYFDDIEICLPSEPSEQTAIAKVLADMDAELASLEKRREKTRALKQAMMQELLTGRTRLV